MSSQRSSHMGSLSTGGLSDGFSLARNLPSMTLTRESRRSKPMRADDIQLALKITGSRNPYILAGWLSELRGHWSAGDMAEVKQALGIDPRQVDAEVASGIGSLIDADDKRRGPRIVTRPRLTPQTRVKRKIDEELQTLANSEVAQMEPRTRH